MAAIPRLGVSCVGASLWAGPSPVALPATSCLASTFARHPADASEQSLDIRRLPAPACHPEWSWPVGSSPPPVIAFRPHLGRRRWLTLRLYPRRRPVSTRRHALVASALSHPHPKHPVGADHQRHGRQLLGTAEPITGPAVRRLPRRPHPIVMGMTTHRRPRHPHLLPMWHGCSGRPKAVARGSLSSIRDGWHVAALSLTAPSRSATGAQATARCLPPKSSDAGSPPSWYLAWLPALRGALPSPSPPPRLGAALRFQTTFLRSAVRTRTALCGKPPSPSLPGVGKKITELARNLPAPPDRGRAQD